MNLYGELDEVFEQYGFGRMNCEKQMKRMIKEQLKIYNEGGFIFEKEDFAVLALYELTLVQKEGEKSEVAIQDAERLATKMKKKDKWNTEEKWLLGYLSVVFEFSKHEYQMQRNRNARKFVLLTTDSGQVEEFRKTHSHTILNDERKIKETFSLEERRKNTKYLLVKEWEEMMEEINESGVLKKLEQALRPILAQIYATEVRKYVLAGPLEI